MKKKGVRVMVGLVLVCLLTGMLGVYSASGWNEVGLTYRRPFSGWQGLGGVKIYTQSNFGGELLIDYSDYTDEDGKDTYLSLQPSLLYRFKGSSNTSPYVGIGFLSITDNWTSGFFRESGFVLLVGVEHFFSEKFSFDLRNTLSFNTWEDIWLWEDYGSSNSLSVDMGISLYI